MRRFRSSGCPIRNRECVPEQTQQRALEYAYSSPLLVGVSHMDNLKSERWFQLCQLAAVEQNSEKLLALVAEINQLLEAKEFERNTRRRQAWKQSAKSDEHQAKSTQPYRGREHHSEDSATNPNNTPVAILPRSLSKGKLKRRRTISGRFSPIFLGKRFFLRDLSLLYYPNL